MKKILNITSAIVAMTAISSQAANTSTTESKKSSKIFTNIGLGTNGINFGLGFKLTPKFALELDGNYLAYNAKQKKT